MSSLRRVTLDRALLGAYGACCLIVLVLLPTDGTVVWIEVGPALGLQILIGVSLVLGTRSGREPASLVTVGVLAYLISVALLRDGTEPTSGVGPLVLLPVVCTSLRGNRRQFSVALAGVACVYILPAVLVGPPQYPLGGWRAGLLLLVLSAALGSALLHLVGQVGELVDKLDRIARADELTGLPNRRAWEEALERELSAAGRSGEPLTVALFDLDGFKDYNDTHGHLAGDRLLLQAAAGWQDQLRTSDVLFRWGGDEFGLLLPGCDREAAVSLIERMRGGRQAVTFSAGVAQWDGRLASEALVAAADQALYQAKAQGRRGRPSPLSPEAGEHHPALAG